MKTLHRAARVERPSHRPPFSGFLLLTLLLFPLAAHAQSGSSPFDTGLTSIQTLFTGTIAKVSSLIAIVLGGYIFGRWITTTDPAFLKIMGKSERFKLRYDAAKQQVPNVEIR
ncbi:TrbC/VirB2 family protein [Granulicella sp. WH15]|uniref:TrbC/VirB2 family protein n=1 Tax=Granulicella sp. WH15 TaxID=2602070 RepID=UPI001366A24A|nr:TrbC/VirB2 family protein [Granulicella sp. WH15]QHN02920.1 TrbC/VirB2 family protein [Granulicella sp. WH15]